MAAIKGKRYCFTHDRSKAKDRAQAHRLGGQHRYTPHFGNARSLPREVRTPADAGAILSYVLAEVLGHDNSLLRARVLLALYDSFAKSFEIGEFETRLAALESALNVRGET